MRSRLISHSAAALSGADHRDAGCAHHCAADAHRRPAGSTQQTRRPVDDRAGRPPLVSPTSFTNFDQRTQQSLITGAFTTVSSRASGHHSAPGDDRAAEPHIPTAGMAPLAGRRRSPTHHHNRLLPRSAPRGI